MTKKKESENPYGVRFISHEELVDLAKSSNDLPSDIAIHKEYIADDIKIHSDKSRRITFAVSTEDVDRDRDIIMADGWKLKAFKKNPVVLWAHSYRELPIAKSVKIGIQDKKLVSTADFVPEDIYSFAETVFQMIKMGILNSASVGFRPLKHIFNEERRGIDILSAELLEWSVVPVPANSEALVQFRSAASPEIVQSYVDWCEKFLDEHYKDNGIWIPRKQVESVFKLLSEKIETQVSEDLPKEDQKIVPENISDELADEKDPWSIPILSDFTEEPWGNLSESRKHEITGHFAWAGTTPPKKFSDLKLPHHNPSDGKVVWRGVSFAMKILINAVDREKEAYNHLVEHYLAFDKVPPEFKSKDSQNGNYSDESKSLENCNEQLDIAMEMHQMNMNEPGTATTKAMRALMNHLKLAQKELIYGIKNTVNTVHPILIRRFECGICDACTLGIGECEEKQNGFDVQSIAFPKRHWASDQSCREWLREHDLKSTDMIETDTSYRFNQKEPEEFTRLRTIPLSPSNIRPNDKRCRIIGIGGPRKQYESNPVLLLEEGESESVLIIDENHLKEGQILVDLDLLDKEIGQSILNGVASVVSDTVRDEINYARGRID